MADLLALSDEGKLGDVLDEDLMLKVSITLFQSSLRAILQQEDNGSWERSVEETAYAILMLTEARRLCFFNEIRKQLESSIGRGAVYLSATAEAPIQKIWSDKVTYGSPSLTEAYILAAQRAIATSLGEGTVGSRVWRNKFGGSMNKQVKLFGQTPLFESTPEWELRASMIEAALYQPLLLNPSLEVIKRDEVAPGAYLTMIPLTWTSCNNRNRTCASVSYLWEMMALSYYTYQIDEFMEAVAGPAFKGRMDDLRKVIDKVTARPPNDPDTYNHNGEVSSRLEGPFESLLYQATEFILGNPIVREASAYDQNTLRQELRVFLHAHATQVEDNQSTSKQMLLQDKSISNHTSPFFRWVRTTSADHIAGAFCFYYAVCLSGATLTPKSHRDCFPTTMEKYFAAATCGHLSSMCRMYNDLGSWTRDSSEGNLNCIHFPEFGGASTSDDAKKATLFKIAQYERSRWNSTLSMLEERMQGSAGDAAAKRLAARRFRIVEMFCDVTDLYGQIYILKDISAPIKDEVRNGNSIGGA